jgi:hypothetical protein
MFLHPVGARVSHGEPGTYFFATLGAEDLVGLQCTTASVAEHGGSFLKDTRESGPAFRVFWDVGWAKTKRPPGSERPLLLGRIVPTRTEPVKTFWEKSYEAGRGVSSDFCEINTFIFNKIEKWSIGREGWHFAAKSGFEGA